MLIDPAVPPRTRAYPRTSVIVVGGTMFGFTVEGASRLIARSPCKLHCHRLEADGIRQVTGLSETDLVRHDSGDRVKVDPTRGVVTVMRD